MPSVTLFSKLNIESEHIKVVSRIKNNLSNLFMILLILR